MIFNGVNIDVEKVVDSLNLEYRKVSHGRELLVECPFDIHTSGQSKLYVNLNSGLWECKACPDKQGGIAKLVSSIKELPYGEAVNFLVEGGSDVDHAEVGEHILSILRARKNRGLRQSDARKGISVSRYREMIPTLFYPWRKTRGFRKRTVRFWNLGYDDESTYPWVIPVIIGGSVKYIIRRARKPGSKYRYKGKTLTRHKYDYSNDMPRNEIIFGLEHMRGSRVVLTEGPLDCIKVWQALDRADLLDEYSPVAIGGDSFSEIQATTIAQSCDQVIIFYDNDEGGQGAAYQTIKKLRGRVDIRTVDYALISQKDPGEMDEDEIVERIVNSLPLAVKMIRRFGG